MRNYGSSPQPEVAGLRHNVCDQDKLRLKYPKLDKDLSADVLVVGAGIAGLRVAYNLAKNGESVVVLESRVRGGGQTGRTTAHLMQWFDDFYHQVEETNGAETAWVVDSQRRAIDWIGQIIKEEKIDCMYKRLDGYLFPHDDSKETLEALQTEHDAAKKFGFDVSKVDLG
ncbi:hypothetical protein Mapa_009250 [Marchantia paleacea]|nr:hypothetical protein Mapa_009250 [Marchantia paleacea]